MDFSFDIRFLSAILDIVIGLALVVVSLRPGKSKKENALMSLGGVITIVMAFFVPETIIPVLMGLGWMLNEYMHQGKIDSPHLGAILATMGIALMVLAFLIPPGPATAVSLVGGGFALFSGLSKLPIP